MTEGQLVTVFDPYTWKSRLVTHLYDVLAHLKSPKEACKHFRSLGGPLLYSQLLSDLQPACRAHECSSSRGLRLHEANPDQREAPMSIVRGLQPAVESHIYEASCEEALPLRSLI